MTKAGSGAALVALAVLAALGLAVADAPAYALDDAYIHLAIARNLWADGVFGVNPGEPGGTSSSILWPVLLAATGAHEAAPLLLGVVSMLGALSAADRLLRDLGARARFAALLVLFFVVPFPALVFSGMEHGLQVWVALEWLVATRPLLAGGPASGRVLVLAALATSVRYEGAFLVGATALCLARRPGVAVAMLVATALPVVGYGLWLESVGWRFLPAGVELKSVAGQRGLDNQLGMLRYVGGRMAASHALLTLGAAWAFLREDPTARVVALATVPAMILVGDSGWMRYEAWLYALLVVTVAPAVVALPTRGWPVLAGATAALTVSLRAVNGVLEVPEATRDIHEQQVQMAAFVRQNFAGRTVIVNDLGAVAWAGDARVIDLVGLGTAEIAEAHVEGRSPWDVVARRVAEGDVPVALLYEAWYPTLPREWVRVATWTDPHPVVLGAPTVSIFATSPAHVAEVRRAAEAFDLPDAVRSRLDATDLDLDVLRALDPAGQREPERWALYGSGALGMVPSRDGTLVLWASGSLADGVGPSFEVNPHGRFRPGTEPEAIVVGPVRGGEELRIVYDDDAVDAAGNDRNLFVWRVELRE